MGEQASSPDAIVAWAEAHTANTAVAPNTGCPHLTNEELVQILRWDAEGKSQQWIGAHLDPPRHQSTISKALKPFKLDTREEAKRIFNAEAASTALKIMREASPRELIAVHRGIGTLEDKSERYSMNIGLVLHGLTDGTFAPKSSTDSADIHRLTVESGSDNS